jgi:hypothetical protein
MRLFTTMLNKLFQNNRSAVWDTTAANVAADKYAVMSIGSVNITARLVPKRNAMVSEPYVRGLVECCTIAADASTSVDRRPVGCVTSPWRDHSRALGALGVSGWPLPCGGGHSLMATEGDSPVDRAFR